MGEGGRLGTEGSIDISRNGRPHDGVVGPGESAGDEAEDGENALHGFGGTIVGCSNESGYICKNLEFELELESTAMLINECDVRVKCREEEKEKRERMGGCGRGLCTRPQ